MRMHLTPTAVCVVLSVFGLYTILSLPILCGIYYNNGGVGEKHCIA